jgi:N-acetylglutamate synthase-like GNAT family acetyltransferase
MNTTLETTPPAFTMRRARLDELDWVNARYLEIDFVPSTLDDLVVIAEANGVAAGMGRVVPVGPDAGELGGMLVFDAFRGSGLARQIITSLLQHSRCRTLYCVPFSELESLYASMGFACIAPDEHTPPAVSAKWRYCLGHYPKPVLLMQRHAASA